MDLSKLRLAIIGASHWHVPLFTAAKEKLRIVAVSDEKADAAEKYAGLFSCKAYTDPIALMEQVKPDFIFAFGKHCDTAALSLEIIKRGIPFSVEKPLGLNAEQVRQVRDAAKAKGVYCSLPLIWRYSDTMPWLVRQIDPADVLNLSFSFICGPTSRYLNTSPWLLERCKAGGGCMTNLGVHFLDMGFWLTGSDDAEVLGASYQYAEPYDVETYATALVRMSSGASMTVQTGYAYPMTESKRDNHWRFTTRKGYYSLENGQLETRLFGDETTVKIQEVITDQDLYFPVYTVRTLRDYMEGKAPAASLDDMLRVRRLMDQIIAAAENGGQTRNGGKNE